MPKSVDSSECDGDDAADLPFEHVHVHDDGGDVHDDGHGKE